MLAANSLTLGHEAPLATELVRELGIAHQVEARLWRSGYLALRGISCEFHDGVAWLRGHLQTYYLKQIAQETVGEVVGVRSVVNQIKVGPPRLPAEGANHEQAGTDRSDGTGWQP
jgi:osmotically-inducible protein OsmY